jgi:L-asparaginase II
VTHKGGGESERDEEETEARDPLSDVHLSALSMLRVRTMTTAGKTLRERIEALCPAVLYDDDGTRYHAPDCSWPGHALAEEVDKMAAAVTKMFTERNAEWKRAEAAERLLAEAPESPVYISWDGWSYDYIAWFKRARAAVSDKGGEW